MCNYTNPQTGFRRCPIKSGYQYNIYCSDLLLFITNRLTNLLLTDKVIIWKRTKIFLKMHCFYYITALFVTTKSLLLYNYFLHYIWYILHVTWYLERGGIIKSCIYTKLTSRTEHNELLSFLLVAERIYHITNYIT